MRTTYNKQYDCVSTPVGIFLYLKALLGTFRNFPSHRGGGKLRILVVAGFLAAYLGQ